MQEKAPEDYTNYKALVVDDDEFQRVLVTKALEFLNITCVTACDAFEGFEKYLQEKPDILVTDFQMPKKTGLELAEEIQKIDPDFQVILVTGSVFQHSDLDQYGAKIFRLIKKPFRLDELRDAVSEVLSQLG